MSKNIVVVTGSPGAGGNSEILADAFTEGARQSGNLVTVFHAGCLSGAPQGGHACTCKPRLKPSHIIWAGRAQGSFHRKVLKKKEKYAAKNP